jgi:hypothetical protein
MSKFFSDLPPELEQYNPDDFIQELNLTSFNEPLHLNTFDEEGRFHSYDDFPSVIKGTGGNFSLRWHQHGVLARDENKPLYIKKYKTHWGTYDNKGHLHSYNDMPAEIASNVDEFIFTWANHGNRERNGDNPSVIRVDDISGQRAFYFKNNVYHRPHDLPAIEEYGSKFWVILGSLHNEKGPAKITLFSGSTPVERKNWYLYGIYMSEEQFEQICSYQKVHNTPLWVAFLHKFKLIDEKVITHFMDEDGIWNANLPTSWLLQALDVTEETWIIFAAQIYEVYKSAYKSPSRLEKEPAVYSRFLDIINYEETINS